MSYTDDWGGQDTQYDEFDPSETDFQERYYGEGYELSLIHI